VQFGGQTPLKLSRALAAAGAPIIGTTPDSIDVAEDRERFQKLVTALKLKQPANASARTEESAVLLARKSVPLVVRPSYVLGGRAMEVVFNRRRSSPIHVGRHESVERQPGAVGSVSGSRHRGGCRRVSDGENVLIGGIMEHIEQAGVHSGDSSRARDDIRSDRVGVLGATVKEAWSRLWSPPSAIKRPSSSRCLVGRVRLGNRTESALRRKCTRTVFLRPGRQTAGAFSKTRMDMIRSDRPFEDFDKMQLEVKASPWSNTSITATGICSIPPGSTPTTIHHRGGKEFIVLSW